MEKLLKSYGFKTEQEYFDMIIISRINGQIKQCKEQFLAMSKEGKIRFIETANLTEREKSAFVIMMIKL